MAQQISTTGWNLDESSNRYWRYGRDAQNNYLLDVNGNYVRVWYSEESQSQEPDHKTNGNFTTAHSFTDEAASKQKRADSNRRSSDSKQDASLTLAHSKSFEADVPRANPNILNKSYWVRKGKEELKFFRLGRVFAVLWSEPAGGNLSGGTENTFFTQYPNSPQFVLGKYGERVYCSIRRFVVVKVRSHFVEACAITTYGRRGATKPGCNPGEHIAVYLAGQDVYTLQEEAQRGMVLDPIAIIPTDPRETMDSMSRVRLGKTYLVERNLKVRDIGMVAKDDRTKLLAYHERAKEGDNVADLSDDEDTAQVGSAYLAVPGTHPSTSAEYDQQNQWEFSDVESTWSESPSISTNTSIGSLQRVQHSAAQKMADIFWSDSSLQRIYPEAAVRTDRNTFYHIHDRLLKTFFEGLRQEEPTDMQLRSIKLLYHRKQRHQITAHIESFIDPQSNQMSPQSIQDSLDQKAHRDERLERFLQGLGKLDEIATSKDAEAPRGPLLDHGDSDDASSDEEVEQSASLPELIAITAFLTGGLSFRRFRMNIYGLAYPEDAIPEVLRNNEKIEVLEDLLARQFKSVAIGDYAWIRELDATGYTKRDIAKLLLEDASDSPWIYFQPRNMTNPPEMDLDFHVADCIHTIQRSDGSQHLIPTSRMSDDDVREHIQELCGLAGIIPCSEVEANWNGRIILQDHNATAQVTYAAVSGVTSLLQIINRCLKTLQDLSTAIAVSQQEFICCNAFTMIALATPQMSHPELVPTSVRLCRIEITHVLQLLNTLDAGRKNLEILNQQSDFEEVDQINLYNLSLSILDPVLRGHIPKRMSATLDLWHVVALATQFASLTYLSYSQAHVSPIQPFFMDTTQTRIELWGSCEPNTASICIIQQATKLTCLDDMLQSPVNVFSVRTPSMSAVDPSDQRYDLCATAEDLLDTWVDGSLLVPNNGDTSYYAIELCGGVIAPFADPNHKMVVDEDVEKFHWTAGYDEPTLQSLHAITERICVGAPFVSVNTQCIINEHQCWESSVPAFEILGVQHTTWRYDEKQIGGQAGQYALLQYNRTKHKMPGTTLKTVIIRDVRTAPYLIRSFLNDHWGVQVSFCTGVARRVPLRILMADLIPVVVKTALDRQVQWEAIDKQHQALQALRTGGTLTWLEALTESQKTFTYNCMQEILLKLERTGVDEDGEKLTVAWIHDLPPYNCFKIACSNKGHSWMRVLQDSGDCATFAYVTCQCLETDSVKCGGPGSLWNNTAPLLETAVLRLNPQPSKPLGPLVHQQKYFFRKMESKFYVTVEKQQNSGVVKLYTERSIIPPEFLRRIRVSDKNRNQSSTIKDRGKCTETGAEAVAILSYS